MIEVTNGASITSKNAGRMLTGLRSIAAKGNKVQLEDGRWYTDWQMGLHGAVFGFAPHWWGRALSHAAECTASNSIACADERIVAELLGGFYPDIEAVRFMLNGSDPCAAASKLVRAITGRDRLLVFGYHGTASAYCTPPEVNARPGLASIDMRRGTLEAERAAFIPLDWLCAYDAMTWQDVAAVVIECPSIDGGRAQAGEWVRTLFTHAHEVGALTVLDEVVTGFRYGPGGASEYLGVSHGMVDLYCFGKTMGNGYPVAALAGKKAVMDELAHGVHFSGTFFGEPLGMAVAKAVLARYNEIRPWAGLAETGRDLMTQWNRAGLECKLEGHPTRPELESLPEDFGPLRRHLFRHKHIIVDHPWYVTTCTTDMDIRTLVERAAEWI
jgi:glutamate-1-semialdehyde aminotransferase